MPCRFIPAGSGNDFLEIGLADVFISRLSQLANVRVLPLTATERLRAEDPRDAARQLRANRVLMITLQRDSGLVRASVHLLSVDDDRTVWATTVDTDAASVFSIQDIIVTRVIEELAPRLESGARSRLAKPGTRNNEAFESVLARPRPCREAHAGRSAARGGPLSRRAPAGSVLRRCVGRARLGLQADADRVRLRARTPCVRRATPPIARSHSSPTMRKRIPSLARWRSGTTGTIHAPRRC